MAAAAAVVSISMGVMKPVLAKLATLMGDKYKKIKGLRKAVVFLQRELGEMEALLEKMDSANELDPQAKIWRRDIIEMSYNIEDRIDDFMHTVSEADNKIEILRKAAKYLRTFNDRRRLANDFQEIKTQVIEASERRKRYMLDQCMSVTTPVVVDPRMQALYKESASLVGIESQKDELVRWVMDKGKQLKFMAIVGFRGIGKTTLANEVYCEVGGKFECKAFISVSQNPQMIGLFNSLLSQLGQPTYSNACQLQDPINDLRVRLHDKRYLIVVDDLWNLQDWQDAIQYAFPQSSHSSRVIITMRNENVVARSCCHNDGQIHNMKHLSEQDSRKLFFGRIFGSEDACPTELMKPSCEILKKCDGLPLAIITMASMLAYQTRELEAWEYILKSLGTKSAPNSTYEDMIYILDLSYKNLPLHLKACFLYLGSYPEYYPIQRDELVRRWVVEGFVSNSDGKHDVWDVAELQQLQHHYGNDVHSQPAVDHNAAGPMLIEAGLTNSLPDPQPLRRPTELPSSEMAEGGDDQLPLQAEEANDASGGQLAEPGSPTAGGARTCSPALGTLHAELSNCDTGNQAVPALMGTITASATPSEGGSPVRAAEPDSPALAANNEGGFCDSQDDEQRQHYYEPGDAN